MPYAFLDDAGLEERRARAVSMRRSVPDSVLGEAGRLSPDAIAEVRAQQWPDVRDEHELHDLLHQLVLVPEDALLAMAGQFAVGSAQGQRDTWTLFFRRLCEANRATVATGPSQCYWIASERLPWARVLLPELLVAQVVPAVDYAMMPAEDVLRRALVGWLSLLGPATAGTLASLLGVSAAEIWKQLLQLEVSGTLMRGVYERAAPTGTTTPDHENRMVRPPLIAADSQAHARRAAQGRGARNAGDLRAMAAGLAAPSPANAAHRRERGCLRRYARWRVLRRLPLSGSEPFCHRA